MPRQKRSFRELAHSWVPFGLGEEKPHHFREMRRIAWENRDNLPYAWKVLTRGVCDGCALGTNGLRDWTISGTQLCLRNSEDRSMPRLPISALALPLLVPSASAQAEEVARLHFGGTSGDFGHAVAINGDWAVIGSPDDNTAGNDAGAAYAYRWNGFSWVFDEKLVASDLNGTEMFGFSVSLSGNVAIVGARGEDPPTDSGAAYVFRYDGTDWVEEQKLKPATIDAIDLFGTAVDVEGDTCVVTAPGRNHPGHNGSGFVYRYNGSSWVLQAELIGWSGLALDQYGLSAAITAEVAFIGAPGHNSSGLPGSVYVYSGPAWGETAQLFGPTARSATSLASASM